VAITHVLIVLTGKKTGGSKGQGQRCRLAIRLKAQAELPLWDASVGKYVVKEIQFDFQMTPAVSNKFQSLAVEIDGGVRLATQAIRKTIHPGTKQFTAENVMFTYTHNNQSFGPIKVECTIESTDRSMCNL